MTFACSILAAALVTAIVRKGWDNTHNYICTAFLAFTIDVAFFGGYPRLASHDDNVKDNEFLFLAHGNLVWLDETHLLLQADDGSTNSSTTSM